MRSKRAQRMEDHAMRMRTSFLVAPLMCLGVIAALVVGSSTLGGCASEKPMAGEGPPPEPYVSWDDYWAAQTEMDRSFRDDVLRAGHEKGGQPGLPR